MYRIELPTLVGVRWYKFANGRFAFLSEHCCNKEFNSLVVTWAGRHEPGWCVADCKHTYSVHHAGMQYASSPARVSAHGGTVCWALAGEDGSTQRVGSSKALPRCPEQFSGSTQQWSLRERFRRELLATACLILTSFISRVSQTCVFAFFAVQWGRRPMSGSPSKRISDIYNGSAPWRQNALKLGKKSPSACPMHSRRLLGRFSLSSSLRQGQWYYHTLPLGW